MCDRPLPQQQLCNDLSELLWVLPTTSSEQAVVMTWLRAFWATMAREWTTGIDVLRMEKFLLLVRRMLGVSLVWMQARSEAPAAKKTKRTAAGKEKKSESGAEVRFDAARVDAALALLAEWPFRQEEELSRGEDDEDEEQDTLDFMPKIVPVGLRLHVLDIWVDEAEKAGLLAEVEEGDAEGEDSSKRSTRTTKKADTTTLSGREVLQRLNGLVETLNEKTLSKAVRIRAKEALSDERLPWVEKEEVVEQTGDGEWGGFGN